MAPENAVDENGNLIPKDPNATENATDPTDGSNLNDASDPNDLSYGQAAALAGQQAIDAAAIASVMPEDNIGGWTETASGTLLDSYHTPE